MIGATVGTFNELFALVARATDAPAGPAISRTQRRRLAREAVARRSCGSSPLPREGPGSRPRSEELVSELQAALVDPPTLREQAAAAGPYEARSRRSTSPTCGSATSCGLRRRRTRWPPPRRPRLRAARGLGIAPGLPLRIRRPDRRTARAGARARRAYAGDGRTALGGSGVAHAGPRRALRAAPGHRGRLDRAAASPSRGSRSSGTLFELERRFGETGPGRSDRERRRASRCSPRRESWRRSRPSAPRWHGCSATACRPARSRSCCGIRAPPARSTGGYCRASGSRLPCRRTSPATRTDTGAGLIALLQAAVGQRRSLRSARLPAHPRGGLPSAGRLVRAQAAARPPADDRRGAGGLGRRGDNDGTTPAARSRSCATPSSGPALLREAGKQARWIAESAIRRQGAVADEDRALELRAGAEIERALAELAELGLPHSAADVIAAVVRRSTCRCGGGRPRAGCG